MNNELKLRILSSAKEFLVVLGWPNNITNDQIIQKLPDLWRKLESEGLLITLIARNFNYRQFVQIALQARDRTNFGIRNF